MRVLVYRPQGATRKPGHGFWVENTGTSALIFVRRGSPPWLGPEEAQPWPDENERSAGC
jgi:hypothetical protein